MPNWRVINYIGVKLKGFFIMSNFNIKGVLYVTDVEITRYRDSNNLAVKVFLSELPKTSAVLPSRINRRTGELVEMTQFSQNTSGYIGENAVFQPQGNALEFLKSMYSVYYDGENEKSGDSWSMVGMPFFGYTIDRTNKTSIKHSRIKSPIYLVKSLGWDEHQIFDAETKFDEINPGYVDNLTKKFIAKDYMLLTERYNKYADAIANGKPRTQTTALDLLRQESKFSITKEKFDELMKMSESQIREFVNKHELGFTGRKNSLLVQLKDLIK